MKQTNNKSGVCMKYKIQYYTIEISDNREEFIRSPENLHECLKDEFDIQEKMILIGLNIKNKILIKKTVAIGGTNTLTLTPKEIFTPLLKLSCSSFILAHNHPSNDVSPSNEDIIFTKKIQKASEIMGLKLLDHIIFTDKKFYSFKSSNLI